MTIEQGKNNLPDPNTPEFAEWAAGQIDVLGSRTKELRGKLREAGLLEFGDISINPNAPHKAWEYRKFVPYKRTGDFYNATFDNTSTTLKIIHNDITETFTISWPAGRPREFSYVQYRSGNTFQFNAGGFGGGYVPEEIMRVHIDESGQYGSGYSRFHYDNPKYIEEAFGDADKMVDEIDASISTPDPKKISGGIDVPIRPSEPLHFVAEHTTSIPEKDSLKKRLSRFFTKS